jgi:hypothetical protein
LTPSEARVQLRFIRRVLPRTSQKTHELQGESEVKSAMILLAGAALGAVAAPALAQAPAAQGNVATAVVAGAKVLDPQGGDVGTVESVSGGNAVIATGTNKVALPLASFAVGPNGPVIGMTRAELDAAAAQAAAQTAASVAAGAKVSGAQGAAIGTVESVEGGFAIVNTGRGKVKLPVTAFAKNETGLVIGMTAAELDAAISAASPAAASSAPAAGSTPAN